MSKISSNWRGGQYNTYIFIEIVQEEQFCFLAFIKEAGKLFLADGFDINPGLS